MSEEKSSLCTVVRELRSTIVVGTDGSITVVSDPNPRVAQDMWYEAHVRPDHVAILTTITAETLAAPHRLQCPECAAVYYVDAESFWELAGELAGDETGPRRALAKNPCPLCSPHGQPPVEDLALVPRGRGCPNCGERDLDKLVWHAGVPELVRCKTCRANFDPIDGELHRLHPLDDIDPEEDLVDNGRGCPICGERHVDKLEFLTDGDCVGDNVRCLRCGAVYDPVTGIPETTPRCPACGHPAHSPAGCSCVVDADGDMCGCDAGIPYLDDDPD